MILRADGGATEGVIVRKQVARAIISPVVVELDRVPQRDKREDVVRLGGIEVKVNDKIQVRLRESGPRRGYHACVWGDLHAFQSQRCSRDLDARNILVLGGLLLRPKFYDTKAAD